MSQQNNNQNEANNQLSQENSKLITEIQSKTEQDCNIQAKLSEQANKHTQNQDKQKVDIEDTNLHENADQPQQILQDRFQEAIQQQPQLNNQKQQLQVKKESSHEQEESPIQKTQALHGQEESPIQKTQILADKHTQQVNNNTQQMNEFAEQVSHQIKQQRVKSLANATQQMHTQMKRQGQVSQRKVIIQSEYNIQHSDAGRPSEEYGIPDFQISAVQKINQAENQANKKLEQNEQDKNHGNTFPLTTEQSLTTENNHSAQAFNVYQNKIQDAVNTKNEGNTLFKNRKFLDAVQKYSEALRFLDPQSFYGATQAECQKMAELSASLLYNIGACYHNISEFKRGVLFFNQAIMVNPKYVKALWKRALCYHQLQKHEQALEDIKKAYELDKSNKQIYDSYALILKSYNENIKIQKQKMKELSQKIFNKSQTGSQKDIAQNQAKVKTTQKKLDELPQNKDTQGNSFWIVPALIGVAALGIWAFKKFK